MLYLSQLVVDGRSREARRDLSDCHALHQRLLHAFPDDAAITSAREHFGVLYRVESEDVSARILVQSRVEPDWSRLPQGYLRRPVSGPKRVDVVYTGIASGRELIFRLRANPTRRIHNRNSEQKAEWRGKRVDVQGEEEQIAWLRRKGELAGFALVQVRMKSNLPERHHVADVRTSGGALRVHGRSEAHQLTFASVVFEGRLRVTDPERFRHALEVGIGSGKAFGFGLLSVASACSTRA